MDNFINPKTYKKELVDIDGEFFTGLYFQDIKGRDWYETLRGWCGAISTDSDDIVVAYEPDAAFTGMAEGRNVYEVDPTKVPRDVLGNYKFRDGIFTDIRPSEEKKFQQHKNDLLVVAALKIAPLQDAIDIGDITDGEATLLLAWQKYRIALNRLEFGQQWPVQPGN